MSTMRPLSRFALIPLVGGVAYTTAVYREISGVPASTVSSEDFVPSSLRNSKTVRIVNPQQLTATGDAYSTRIDIPNRHKDVTDEILLASYLNGFFGSWVFAPERFLLTAFRPRSLTKFSGLPSSRHEKYIWSTKDTYEQTLPPLHSKLFGVFQVLNVDFSKTAKTGARESIIDVGFGSNTSRFSGCHRLSIERTGTKAHLHLACTSCNPSTDSPLRSGVLKSFHRVYAMLLFRAAAAHVKRKLAKG
jgi:hypothetical protein